MSDSDLDQVEPVFRLIYRSHSLIGPNAPRAELGAIFQQRPAQQPAPRGNGRARDLR